VLNLVLINYFLGKSKAFRVANLYELNAHDVIIK
ncbi:MAG: hypothetical protein RL440_1153, partial [Bacteroidota bacterium]